ncbi:chemotaxis protein MotC [Methylobacterium sp. 275MFSha3.1]|uniref:chemotaxis protein n=1 Tax=Methylobacterium sp. 275MFSha3.1 TaxID=1502746 RepID=UPI0008A79523|nr:chemotaxis protein [Methylobacterium sp. 275MFSha3.1]SEH32207.1 chemotaxis protein MotC [Methylobacterium sp. 275MFSha3.1]
MKVSRTGRIVAAALGLLIAGRAAPVAAEPAGGPPAAPAADPQAPTGDPVQWVRTLQLLQDRVAAGSRAAHESQPLLIARINADLLAAPPEIWGRRSNLRAAITFALSGGGPSVLRRLTAQDGLGEPEATLARGALAYVEGREAEARRLLQDVDTTDLPPTLAGAIGLTQASLAVPDQPIRAIALLDRVRVLLPGTLTEEGALRREIFTLGQIGDLKTFEALAIQYLRRFPHSIYAGNFRQRLAYQLTQFDIGHDAERFATLNRILDELGPESRRDLYLVVAQTAIQAGQTAAALRASEKALALCAPGSAEATRGQLYRAAAEIVSLATFESGSRTLRSLDRAKLTARDMPLLETALSTTEAIGRGLAGRPGLPEADAAAKPARAAPDPADGPASLIPKAQATIDRIDLMLSKATP